MSLAQLSEMISLKETGRGRLGFSPLVKEPERAAAAYVITKEAEGRRGIDIVKS